MSELDVVKDTNYRPDNFSLSNSEVRATGILCGGSVENIARELLALRAENARLKAPVSTAEIMRFDLERPMRSIESLIAARAKEQP